MTVRRKSCYKNEATLRKVDGISDRALAGSQPWGHGGMVDATDLKSVDRTEIGKTRLNSSHVD